MSTIPVVDVSSAINSVEGSDPVVQQIHDAFTTVGFVFITGHGIPRELVSRLTGCRGIFIREIKYPVTPVSRPSVRPVTVSIVL